MDTYTIKTGYNSFNKVYTSHAFFDNGKQITLEWGDSKEESEARLEKRLKETLPTYTRV